MIRYDGDYDEARPQRSQIEQHSAHIKMFERRTRTDQHVVAWPRQGISLKGVESQLLLHIIIAVRK